MVLLSSMFWIMAGILYIVYRGLKEEREKTVYALVIIAGILLIAGVIGILSSLEEITGSFVLGILGLLIVIALLGFVAYRMIADFVKQLGGESRDKAVNQRLWEKVYSIPVDKEEVDRVILDAHGHLDDRYDREKAVEKWRQRLRVGLYPELFDPAKEEPEYYAELHRHANNTQTK